MGETTLLLHEATPFWPEISVSNNTKKAKQQGEPATKLKNKQYEKELRKLQTRLVQMQEWVKSTNAKIVVVFEGRDAAGKGGVIHRIMALSSSSSVAWDFDVRTGKDLWIGDLRGMFGIESDRRMVAVSDFYDSVHADDRRQVAEAVANARATHSDYYAEFRIIRKDNQTRWVSARGSFFYGKTGNPERMAGVAMDITERKVTLEALAKSQEKFAKAFRQSPMWLAIARARDHVNPPNKVILTLEDNSNQEFTIPKNQKFNIDGEEKDAFQLKKGMRITATKVVEEPVSSVEHTRQVTGSMPPPPPAPAPDLPILVAVVTPVQVAQAPEAAAPPEQLPKTGSTIPLLALLGISSLLGSLGLRVARLVSRT